MENKTRDYNYCGKTYNYKIVPFGYTEIIIISYSYAGTYVQAYKLDTLSIQQAMQQYHEFLKTK